MIIIDTREPSEYATSHIDGAINIPPGEFMSAEVPGVLSEVPRDEEIVLYYRSGQRSNTCRMILRQHGFTNLVNGTNEMRVKALLEKRR